MRYNCIVFIFIPFSGLHKWHTHQHTIVFPASVFAFSSIPASTYVLYTRRKPNACYRNSTIRHSSDQFKAALHSKPAFSIFLFNCFDSKRIGQCKRALGNSPSSNRVICLVTDPLLLAFILGTRKQATTFVLGNEISEIAIPGTIIPHEQESKWNIYWK